MPRKPNTERRLIHAVGARNHWFTPAVDLQRDIERTDGIKAGRTFITGVLNSPSPTEAMKYVERRRKEWDKQHATTEG